MPHPAALLCECRHRPRRRSAAEQGDELSPLHGPSIRAAKPYHIAELKTALSITAKLVGGAYRDFLGSCVSYLTLRSPS